MKFSKKLPAYRFYRECWHSIDTQPEFSEEELIKVIKIKRQNSRKEIVAYFGVSLGTVQRYLNTMKSALYVWNGKSGHWEIKQD